MKLRNILTSLVAIAAVAVGCVKEEDAHLAELQVSKSYVTLPIEGGEYEIEVNAVADWTISDESIPEWLTVQPQSGKAGKTKVKFSAAASAKTNEIILHFVCSGATQIVNVLQMAEKVDLPVTPVKDILAGDDGTTYRAKGTCLRISNTTYGNWDLVDETGSVYIYGTLYEGAEKQFSKLGLEEGDIVTVEGPKTTYGSTIELVNVTVIAIEKSLIKVDGVEPEDAVIAKEGGDFKVNLTVKGNGVSIDIPEEAKSWLSVTSANVSGAAAVVTFHAAENLMGDRSVELTFKTTKGDKEYTAVTSMTQKGSIIEATAAEINAAADGETQYRITGYVSKIASTQYGNLYIKDFSGEVYVYGTNDFANSGVEEGDIITVVGPKTSYKDAPQMKNVTVENRIDVKDISLADFRALQDNKEAYYRISGKVAKSTEENTKFDLDQYGNFALTADGTEVYVYGVKTGWGGEKGKFGELGVKEGDELTIVCYKTSYKGLVEADGCFYVSHKDGSSVGPEPGEGTVVYTLDTTAADVKGPNNSYTGNCDVTVGGITWNVEGNATMNPWRIGGKSISGVDRAVYTKTACDKALTGIVLTLGTISLDVNSSKLVYSANADFSNATEVSFDATADGEIAIKGAFPANSYYKFVFNLTNTATSNKFVQFSKVQFIGK